MAVLATDPPVSERQRRAMFAAAHAHSTLGIPKEVGEEFVGRDAAGHAAGILFVAPDGDVLLLRRASTEPNFAGHWALPGGKADDGETPEQTAAREAKEEIGEFPAGRMKALDQRITPNGMAFHTFAQSVDKKFAPRLNGEHSGFAWAPLHMLPQPVHPAVAKTLHERLGVSPDLSGDDWSALRQNFGKWARDEAPFRENDHPRAQNGRFGSGGGSGGGVPSKRIGKSLEALGFKHAGKRTLKNKIADHAETIKKHGKETAEYLKSTPAKQVARDVTHSHAAAEALSFALQSLVSHGTGILSHATHGAIPNVQGLDPSTWGLNEKLFDHTVNHFADIAAITVLQAKDTMRKAVKGLIAQRDALRAGPKAHVGADDADGITDVLNALLDLLGDDDDDVVEDSGFSESDHPRGQPGNAGQFGPGGSGSSGAGQELSDKEKMTLSRYGEGHSYNVNRYLRDPKSAKAEAKKNFGARAGEYIKGLEATSKTIDAVINKSILSKDTELFRGVSDFSHIRDAVANLKPGESFTLPTFSSTSRSKEWATDFMSGKSGDKGMMVINAKAGSKALDMDQFARHGSEEQEMLIGRNQPLVFDRYDPESKTVYLTLAANKPTSGRDAGAEDAATPVIDRDHDVRWINSEIEMAGDAASSPGAAVLFTKIPAGIAFDRNSVRRYDSDGRLHVERSHISKANVCPYLGREIPEWEKLGLDPDRIYKLLRHPDELAKAAPTFNNLPLLSQHVAVSAADHHPELVIGSTGTDAVFEPPYLDNSLVLWAQNGGIDDVESDAKKELSSAYRYRADMTPGTYEGEAYDGVMRDIIGNHVAIVKEGRAGTDVVVGDSKENLTMAAKPIILTRKAALVMGALTPLLAPKLAKDAKLDLSTILAGVTPKNFTAQKPKIAAAIKDAAKGKLAKDASLDDVEKVLDMLEAHDPNERGTEDAMETDPNSGMPMAEPKKVMDADPIAKLKAWLKGKIPDEELAKIDEIAGAEAGAADETPEEKKAREEKEAKQAKDAENDKMKDMVDKKAMDAAITAATTSTEKRVRDDVLRTQREIRQAENDVRPYVGELSTDLSFDSAEQVHRHALKMLGVDGHDTIHATALRTILLMQPKAGAREAPRHRGVGVGMDAATVKSAAERFPGSERIGRV